jgi:hypothetical protein
VFTHNTPRTGNEDCKPQRAGSKRITGVVAMGTAIAFGTGFALAAPFSASAATLPHSTAQGKFLSGSLIGTNSDRIAALHAAGASNNGKQSSQVSRDPLAVSALDSTILHSPSGIQLNLGRVIDLGALNQYAIADKDGSSMAASGAISNDGGIGVGKVGAGASGSTTIDLESLLGARFTSVLSDLKLQADAIAAQARAKLTVASGEYSLAGLKLNFTSPAIANLGSKVSKSLAPVTAKLNALGGSNGDLADAVNGTVSRVSPLLDILGAHATVNARVSANLQAALHPLLTGSYGNDGVSFNLKTGAVAVDLAKLLGGDINSEPVGTQVLSDRVVNQILHGITGIVSKLGDQLVAKARTALHNAKVDVDVALDTSTAQAPLLGQTCVNAGAGAGTGGGSGTGGGLIGGLVGGGGGIGGGGNSGGTGIGGTVGALVCANTSTLLPNLKTSLGVHIHGTVDQLLAGKASQATAKAKVLGVPVSVNLGRILGGIGSTLTNRLLDSNSAITQLDSALDSQLVDPATTGLLGSGTSVGTALKNVLSVTLNNQDTTTGAGGSTFTETALRVGVLSPAATGGVATIDLAKAAVGPNITTVVAPGSPSDPGNPGTPGNPGNPGTPTAPGSPSNPGGGGTSGGGAGGGTISGASVTPTAFSNLAFTGVAIGTLVALVLALLAAGAYLVREGYRRNSRRQISD